MNEKLRLHRHEELVESMALAIVRLKGWGHMEGTITQTNVRRQAAAALDALLDAAVRLGVARHQDGAGFKYLILSMETSDDK